MDDSLVDPIDDGSMALAPEQFDPLCEVRGEPYPRNGTEIDAYYEWSQQ
jgi:hypothetical protein